MKFMLPILLLPLLLLTGCAGVDKSRVEAELVKLEQRASELKAFIDHNAPLVLQLQALADQTKDPQLQAAAAKIAASVATAQAALPVVADAIESTKAKVTELEEDAAGRVPWWSLLAPAGLLLTRMIPVVGPAVAEMAWALLASKKQKAADLVPVKA